LKYYSQHNVLPYEYCSANSSAHLIYLTFLSLAVVNRFWSRKLSLNTPKITSFLLKNCKNTMPPAAGATPPNLNISRLLLRTHRCALSYNRRFHVT